MRIHGATKCALHGFHNVDRRERAVRRGYLRHCVDNADDDSHVVAADTFPTSTHVYGVKRGVPPVTKEAVAGRMMRQCEEEYAAKLRESKKQREQQEEQATEALI